MGLIPKQHLLVWKVLEKNGRVLRSPEKRQKDVGFSALNSDSAGGESGTTALGGAAPHSEGWRACPVTSRVERKPISSSQQTRHSLSKGGRNQMSLALETWLGSPVTKE